MQRDDLQEILDAGKGVREPLKADIPTFEEKCPKCKGSGRFVSWAGRDVGPCLHCKGNGKMQYKTAPTARANGRAYSAHRRAKKIEENLSGFALKHPDEWDWIRQHRDRIAFAGNMYVALERYGDLTPGQMQAVQRNTVKTKERQEAAAGRIANAPVVDPTPIIEAFKKASATLKRPILRVGALKFSWAAANSKNAGCLYVKSTSGDYLGKITTDKFISSRECDDMGLTPKALETIADPKGAAIRHGRLTGMCACCGAELSNAESIARGIGPICATKFGF